MNEPEHLQGDKTGAFAGFDRGSRRAEPELLGAVMSLIPGAAVAVGGDGVIVLANEQAERLFGYPPGSLTGNPMEALVPERRRSRHRGHRVSFTAAAEPRAMGAGLELSGRRFDGTEIPVDISLAPIDTAVGQLVIAGIRDMSEQMRAQAVQAELATLVRSSFDAIVSTTLDGHISSWNPAAQTLLGYSVDHIIGQHISVLVPAEESLALEELLDAASRGVQVAARDTRWRDRAGKAINVEITVSPLEDQTGRLRGFSAILRDVSERKRVERELNRLLQEEERLQRGYAASAEIRLALLSETTLEGCLTLICERASELVEAPVAAICIRRDDTTRVVAGSGPASTLVGSVLPQGRSFAEKVIESGHPLEADTRSEISNAEVPDDMPGGPTFGVPIVSAEGRSPSAALTFVRPAGAREFEPAVRLLAEALAAQAALAFELDGAQRRKQEMLLLTDRDRIARNLYSQVIHNLFAAGLQLQGSMRLISYSEANEMVSAAVQAIDTAIRDIRNTIFELSSDTNQEPLG